MLEPLLQLRADWRQAAVVTVPAEAAELAPLLDAALNELDKHNQLDEAGLDMAIGVICGSLPQETEDVRTILKDRLSRASRDYMTMVAVSRPDTSEGPDAFGSAEELADALRFMMEGGGAEEETASDDEAAGAAAVATGPARLDQGQLHKALKKQQKPKTGWRQRMGILFDIIRAVLILILVGAVIYILLHPKLLESQVTTHNTVNTTVSAPASPS